MSSLQRGRANLLCIVLILLDVLEGMVMHCNYLIQILQVKDLSRSSEIWLDPNGFGLVHIIAGDLSHMIF